MMISMVVVCGCWYFGFGSILGYLFVLSFGFFVGRGCGFGLGLFVGELDYVVALILVVRLSWYLMVGSRFLTCMFSWVYRLCYDLIWVAFACLIVVLVFV